MPYPVFDINRYRHFKGSRPIHRIRFFRLPNFVGFYGRVFGSNPEYILSVGIAW